MTYSVTSRRTTFLVKCFGFEGDIITRRITSFFKVTRGDLRLQVVGPRSLGLEVTYSVTSRRTTFSRPVLWVTYLVTSGRTTFHKIYSGIVMGDLRLQVVGPRSIGISGTILGLLWVTHSVTSGRTTFHRNFKIMYFESSWVTYSVTSGRTTFHEHLKILFCSFHG